MSTAIIDLAEEAARAHKRAEKANREAAQADARLRDAMRRFAEEHPHVEVRRG